MATDGSKRRESSSSFFSFDTVRSMTRTGSGPACRLPDENDPPPQSIDSTLQAGISYKHADSLNRQIPSNRKSRSPVRNPDLRRFPKGNRSSKLPDPDLNKSLPPSPADEDFKQQGGRRFSWMSTFSNHRSDRNKPLPHLSKNDSFLTSKSGGSLDDATSTSITRIASVQCGHLSNSNLKQSAWDPNAGWVPAPTMLPNEVTTVTGASKSEDMIDSAIGNCGQKEKGKAKLSLINALGNNINLSKLRGELSHRLRLPNVVVRGNSLLNENFVQIGKNSKAPSPVQKRVARRRAEGINLAKHKIRELTGHGNVKRKPAVNRVGSSAGSDSERKVALLATRIESSMSGEVNTKGWPLEQGKASFDFSDFETSVVNAVEGLNAESLPATSSLPQGLSAGQLTTATGTKIGDPPPQPPSLGLKLPQDATMGNNMSTATSSSSHLATTAQEPRTSPVAKVGNTQSREGHVHPLRSHPNITAFAEPVIHMQRTATPPCTKPRIEVTKEEDEIEVLANAPIFSPSLGQLNHYARLTPSPARSTQSLYTAPTLTPGNLHRLPIPETPTRPSYKGAAEQYAAHKKAKKVMKKSSVIPRLFPSSKSDRGLVNPKEEEALIVVDESDHVETEVPPVRKDDRQTIEAKSTGDEPRAKKSRPFVFHIFHGRKAKAGTAKETGSQAGGLVASMSSMTLRRRKQESTEPSSEDVPAGVAEESGMKEAQNAATSFRDVDEGDREIFGTQKNVDEQETGTRKAKEDEEEDKKEDLDDPRELQLSPYRIGGPRSRIFGWGPAGVQPD